MGLLQSDFDEDTLMFSCFEILWNVLDGKQGIEVAKFFSQPGHFRVMCETLRKSSVDCYRQVEKQKRNELALICCTIFQFDPASAGQIGNYSTLFFELLTNQELADKITEFSLVFCK